MKEMEMNGKQSPHNSLYLGVFVNAQVVNVVVHLLQSRGQFRFCNSIPIPVISIPIQFRLRYKIPKAIQFQFR